MVNNCEICGLNNFTTIATRIREGLGIILKCNNCGLILQDINWGLPQTKDYYEKDYQQTNSLVSGAIQTPAERFQHRLKTISPTFNKIKPHLRSNFSVIDIGCGAGALLSLIAPFVKNCVGVELNTPFVEFIKNKLSIDAFSEDINKLKLMHTFDLITCIDTLDHLKNPLETITTMKHLLTPTGKIYIEVPNVNEALNLYLPAQNKAKYNEFFWHRAHQFYFGKETLSSLFKKAEMLTKITSRHNYTLKNFLNWYFTGSPQISYVEGCTDSNFFKENTIFGEKMNHMLETAELDFKKILSETYAGDTLCCIAQPI